MAAFKATESLISIPILPLKLLLKKLTSAVQDAARMSRRLAMRIPLTPRSNCSHGDSCSFSRYR